MPTWSTSTKDKGEEERSYGGTIRTNRDGESNPSRENVAYNESECIWYCLTIRLKVLLSFDWQCSIHLLPTRFSAQTTVQGRNRLHKQLHQILQAQKQGEEEARITTHHKRKPANPQTNPGRQTNVQPSKVGRRGKSEREDTRQHMRVQATRKKRRKTDNWRRRFYLWLPWLWGYFTLSSIICSVIFLQ